MIQRNAKEVEQPETQQHQSPSAEEREGEVSIVPEDEKWRLAERQGRWDRLLDSRPRSEEFITDWVQQVLATSDMDSHLDAKNNVQSRTEEDAKVVPHVQLHSELSAAASLRVKREQYADENPRENSELKKNEPDGEDNANDDLANEQNTGENNITEEKESSDFPRTTTINIQTENRGQFDDASDNASTSSEDSVDLRANKRLKAN